MKIQFIAQSGFLISLENEVNILIDPWLDNPVFPINSRDLPTIDYVFCTHDHVDHGFKTAIEIAKRDDALLITGYDMGKFASERGVQRVESCNPGGFIKLDDLEVKLVQAVHSSDVGISVGFMIRAEDKIIYHMGDTGYFAETKNFGEMYNIDILMIPIGGRYTLDPFEAEFVVKNIGAKYVIPMHYNTFSKIAQNPNEFKENVENSSSSKVLIINPGEAISLN